MVSTFQNNLTAPLKLRWCGVSTKSFKTPVSLFWLQELLPCNKRGSAVFKLDLYSFLFLKKIENSFKGIIY